MIQLPSFDDSISTLESINKTTDGQARSCLSSPRNQKKKSMRRVHFAQCAEMRLVASASQEYNEEEIRQCWYSPKDYSRFKQQMRRHLSHSHHLVVQMDKLHDQLARLCSQKDGDDQAILMMQEPRVQDFLQTWTHLCQGLENGCFFTNNSRYLVQSFVLEMYHLGETAQGLAQTSLEQSYPSRILAIWLGQVNAQYQVSQDEYDMLICQIFQSYYRRCREAMDISDDASMSVVFDYEDKDKDKDDQEEEEEEEEEEESGDEIDLAERRIDRHSPGCVTFHGRAKPRAFVDAVRAKA